MLKLREQMFIHRCGICYNNHMRFSFHKQIERERERESSVPRIGVQARRAFTLIELLVVIAIIAILSVVVILTLNPAELLRQSRDSNRLSDLATTQSAISLYNTDQSGSSGYSLGSSTVTYLSTPDPAATTTAGTDCSGLGFPSGGAFHCAASSTFKKTDGTGWIPINLSTISSGAPLSNLPVDPINSTSSNEYYTYQTNGTTFRLVAVPESQKYAAAAGANPQAFIAGSNININGGTWVLVPGNSTFGTNDFYVMKYDAVCTDGNGNYLNDYNSGYNSYSNSSKNCTAANGRQISSLPSGWPIANISQTSAITYCASIGAHLITNNEWQTIAWNAEGVASNWSSGTVGTGYIYSGHNDNAPATALPADPNDANGYSGDTNVGGNQKRTLTLSNGSVVWDMAGNVWQWTNDTIQDQNQPTAGAGGFAWRQFTVITTWGTMTQQTAGPANSAWNSSQGIGEIYSDGTSGNTTLYGFIRGGNWNAGGVAGVESLSLSNTPGYTLNYIGFRCAR
jgi:prepilin-type N-terminal cleavage/methylation domain-containing protein